MRLNTKIFLCTCLGMACLTGLAYGAPKAVVVSDPTYNAGDLLQGQPFTHDFILKNAGNAALTIKAEPCWGVKVTAPEGPWQPGATGKISVSVTTLYWKTVTLEKDIHITTNDPLNQQINLKIMAQIHEILATNPPYMNFGKVKPGSKTTKAITLVNTGKDAIKVSQITADPAAQIKVVSPQRLTLKPGAQAPLKVSFSAGKTPGVVNGNIFVKSDLASLPEKPIFVQATVVARP